MLPTSADAEYGMYYGYVDGLGLGSYFSYSLRSKCGTGADQVCRGLFDPGTGIGRLQAPSRKYRLKIDRFQAFSGWEVPVEFEVIYN